MGKQTEQLAEQLELFKRAREEGERFEGFKTLEQAKAYAEWLADLDMPN